MNLTGLSEFLRGNLSKVTMVALIIVFTFWGFFSIGQFISQGGFGQKPLPQNLEFDLPSFATASTQYALGFKKDALGKLPNRAKTYQAQIDFGNDQFSQLAKTLGMSGTSSSQNGSIKLTVGNKSLTYSEQRNQITYSYSQNTSSTTNRGFSEELLKKQAIDYLGNLKLLPEALAVTKLSFLGEGLEPKEVAASQAVLATVTVEVSIEKVPIVESAVITFDSQGGVVNFSLYPLKVGSAVSTYRLKKFTELEADVKAKNIQTVSFGKESDALETGATVKSANFATIKISYSLQTGSRLLQPVYVLSGEAEVGDRQTTIEAVVPAIAGVRINP